MGRHSACRPRRGEGRAVRPDRVMRAVFAAELGKVLRAPAIWGFLAACLCLNAACSAIAARDHGAAVDYVSHVAAESGTSMDAGFLRRIGRLPESPARDDLLAQVGSVIGGVVDATSAGNEDASGASASAGGPARPSTAMSAYDGEAVGERYAALLHEFRQDALVAPMRAKYRLVGDRAAHLARERADLDLYAAGLTMTVHDDLFGGVDGLLSRIVLESWAFGAFAALHLLGCERRHRTAPLVDASLVGRRLTAIKIAAATLVALGGFTLLTAGSLAAHLAMTDLSGILGSSVSSAFNAIASPWGSQPFITWADFTLGGYLAAQVTLSLALVLVVALAACALGVLCPDAYAAVGLLAVGGLVPYAALTVCEDRHWWIAYQLLSAHPAYALANQSQWFTDMSYDAVVPWQETWSVAVGLAVAVVALTVAVRRRGRIDLP
ncbi:hypothetical protein JS528_05810 [Bifidobacterium sp. MA2]|uniref:ABC transporter permease n=1 Tax=Bifidobacterium santillanense TaxID=2809028 RepID=A0ABS5UPR2_9BIFI|nr:hypothetical protein [Bifidobacterium santillanense]MBT1172876.1 hypothetical protein [Bifidobacterium santillanense]